MSVAGGSFGGTKSGASLRKAQVCWVHVFSFHPRFGCDDDGDDEEDDTCEVDDADHEGVIVLWSVLSSRLAPHCSLPFFCTLSPCFANSNHI